MKEPQVSVGILFAPLIEFGLLGRFRINGEEISGEQSVVYNNGAVCWRGLRYNELLFESNDGNNALFELRNVTIGVNFHWERHEHQRFQGTLKIIVEDGRLTAINIVDVESYLTSVISSEMSATASLELLKAHAVISRSWLLAQINKDKAPIEPACVCATVETTKDELVRWYDREDHAHFDVCADDHCQRYQGVARASTPTVSEAVRGTHGQVLMFAGEICDARFSKCCGGVFEEFQNCWEARKVPYLVRQRDSKSMLELPDLTGERAAENWIRTSPASFCNTTDKGILSQVLNSYDQETAHFYRWQVEYTQEELSGLLKKRSGTDFGTIRDLIPVQRGTSGRLVKLKIVGSKRTLTVGKELEIRRILSESHLYSSAFVIDKHYKDNADTPTAFTLTGAGWGHGVGLCQIGAAVMGDQGYSYHEILTHYYPEAGIKTLY